MLLAYLTVKVSPNPQEKFLFLSTLIPTESTLRIIATCFFSHVRLAIILCYDVWNIQGIDGRFLRIHTAHPYYLK